MKKVILYTDGACSGNPGAGGWAFVLVYNKHQKACSGGEKETTNNRMELTAVIKGLEALKEPCNVKVFSDSAYVVNAFLQNWIVSWQVNNWRTASKHDVLNKDLWEKLLKLTNYHTIEFNKVKGHADDELNNLCDRLDVGEVQKIKEEQN